MGAKPHGNLWRRVRRLFAGDEAASPAPVRQAQQRTAADPPPPPPQPRQQAFDRAEQARIEELLAQRPADANVVGGRINLLNIDEIRHRLGAKWPRYEEQVHQLVADTLKRRLSEKDFFTRSGDDTYMILFHSSSETEAKLKCALLGQEISRIFFGELESVTDCVLKVETLVTTVEGGVARQGIHLADAVVGALASVAQSPENETRRQRDGTLTPEEIAELLGVAEERFQELEGEGKSPEEISIVRDYMRELIRQLKNIERVLASPDQQWVGMAADQPEPDVTFTWQGEQVRPADAVRAFIARADRAIERAGKPVVWVYDDDEAQSAAADIRTSYLPIWSAAKQSISLYLACSEIMADGLAGAASAPIDAEAELNLIAILDRITLRRAKAELEAIADNGMTCLIVVPVHFSTLNRPGAAEGYLPICHGIPQELRKMIVWEIRRAPLDSWSMHFPRIVSGLQSLGRAVFVLCDLRNFSAPALHRTFSRLSGINVQAVGLDAASRGASGSGLTSYLERFAAAASKHSLASYAHGVHALSINTAAICAGFEHISGKVIAEPLAAPGGVREVPLDYFYSRATADVARGT